MITIYERNIWKAIVQKQHPHYMPLNDFTISLTIQEGKYADALEADPLLHQKLIDNLNDFVNNKTFNFLSEKVAKTENNVKRYIDTKDFDSLEKEYIEFGVYTRYLLSITNENLKYLVTTTITSFAKDKNAVRLYHAGIGFKMVVKVAGIGFSIVSLSVGIGSTVASVFTGGATTVPAVAGLVVGFVGLIQSSCELAREIVNAIETLDMAKNDALNSLQTLEKRYKGNSNGVVGAREVLGQGVNKVFSGFVEINTIKTLTGKFDLWDKKILVVDQNCHKLSRNLTQTLLKADEIKRIINVASRPPVPSREGIKLKVPPPIPSKTNRSVINSKGQFSPPIPSKQGRISGNALKEIYSNSVPPPIPSRVGRMPVPIINPTPAPQKSGIEPYEHIKQIQKKRNQLNKISLRVNKTIPKIQELQIEVRNNRRINTHYKNALIKLKMRKPRVVEFIEAINNVTIDLTKAGINMGLGAHGMFEGLTDTAKTTSSVLHSIGSFVVESTVEAAQLSMDLTDEMGELGDAINEKDKITRTTLKKRITV